MKKGVTSWYQLLLLPICFATMLGMTYYLASPPHVALLACMCMLLAVGLWQGHRWSALERTMCLGIYEALSAFLVIGLIGILSAVWMLSGTIPTIVYYGISYMSARWFYVSSLVTCALMSSFCGSSVFTVMTLGGPLIGIAQAMPGVSTAMAAGAIVSGAAFGDKCSPLSDTTNLAASLCKVDLYVHVRHLLWTTLPSVLLTIVLFGFLGRHIPAQAMSGELLEIQQTLAGSFRISIWTLVPPVVVGLLAMRRCPAVLSFSIGIVAGLLVTVAVQGNLRVTEWVQVIQNGYRAETGNATVDKLINRGGLLQDAMFGISLIGIALAFGSLLQMLGVIDCWMSLVVDKLRSRGSTTLAAGLSAVLVNFLIGEQYLSIILPGKAFREVFDKQEIARQHLSRTLEDCGTLVNPLVPWGICGAIFARSLQVSVYAYMPFAFFLYLSPALTILLGFWTRKSTRGTLVV